MNRSTGHSASISVSQAFAEDLGDACVANGELPAPHNAALRPATTAPARLPAAATSGKAVETPTGLLTAAAATAPRGGGSRLAATATLGATNQQMYNLKTSRGRTFLKDRAAPNETLPQLLPKGLPYVANFVSFEELKQRGTLSTSRKDEVPITADELHLLYQAKCVDQSLAPSWEREVRFMELVSANCRGSFFCLPENGFGPASAEAIKHVLSANKRYSVLDLAGNRLGDDGAHSIAELLKVNRSLVHVGLSSNDIGHLGGVSIAQALEQNNTVISLDLSAKFGVNGNHIGSTGAQAVGHLLKVNQVLWKLCLGSNGLGAVGLSHLVDGLMNNTHLTHLDLSGNSLGPEGASVLASVLEQGNLKWLCLQRNALGDTGGKVLFESVSRVLEATGSDALEYLDVEYNDLGHLTAKAVGKALSVVTVLRTLRLSGNVFSGTKRGSASAATKHIADGLCENKSLNTLSLSGCGLRENDGAPFGKLLSCNTTLSSLDLSRNKLKDVGAKDIARGLANNKGMVRLNLSANKIGDVGGKEIASSLTHNSKLRELNLRRNDMSPVTGDYLSETLRSNNTLEKMDVSYNDFSYKSSLAISTLLDRNAKSNKQLVVPRLTSEIEVLAPKERELSQVEEEIDMEKRIIKDRSEQILRRNEESRVVLEKMRRDVIELEKNVERLRTSCEEAEEMFRRTEDLVTNETSTLKGRKANMDTRIQQEKDRVDRLQREMDKMRRQIKQIEEGENIQLAPLIAELRQAGVDCEREKQDAKFEAEKLASLALRKKELEIAINTSSKKKGK